MVRPISFSASGGLLAEGARFNNQLHKLPGGGTTFVPKGVYHFKTHAETNHHADTCLVEGMTRIALERERSRKSVR
jgi:hypothetical protein